MSPAKKAQTAGCVGSSDPKKRGRDALTYSAGCPQPKATLQRNACPHIALYPGTFDPITYGHRDIIERTARQFDRLVIAVASDAHKTPTYDQAQRIAWVRAVSQEFPNVAVRPLDGLTVSLAREEGATVIIRGIRAVSDFEYEFQMAQMNRHLDNGIETLFLMTSPAYLYVSSSIVKQLAAIDPSRVRDLVPDCVWREAFAGSAAK